MTGSAKKDALRRCITTMGHRHVRVRRDAINNRKFKRCKKKFIDTHFFLQLVPIQHHEASERRQCSLLPPLRAPLLLQRNFRVAPKRRAGINPKVKPPVSRRHAPREGHRLAITHLARRQAVVPGESIKAVPASAARGSSRHGYRSRDRGSAVPCSRPPRLRE